MSQNPYRAGAPVGGDTDAFVGRENILNAIKNVANDLHRNALILYGQRRIGKTSLLKQTEMLLQDSHCPIFVDWQEKADWPLSKVLEELAYIVSVSLGQAKPSLGTDPNASFKQWLADQLLNSQNKPLLFLFDEFDVIATSKTSKEILIYLSQLLTLNAQRLTVIFSVGCKIEQLPNEWFKIREIENQFISLFTQTETEELIRLSEKNQTLEWTVPAISEVWRLAAGHPFFTQQLCAKVWDYLYQKNPSQPPLVTVNSINAIIPQLDTADNILQSLWRSLSLAEQIVAIILAQPQIRWAEFVNPLKKIESLLEQARSSLIKWELINEQPNDSYRFKVEIIRRYVETRKECYYDNLEKIISHAPDIYNIAKQLYEEGNSESAKVLLEQVNQLNPYHTKASLLLADILIAEKGFEFARQVLEDLYQYNPDGASKQLINVLLELAKLQEQDETQQLALYNRVLDIKADHSDAIKAKRTILQQQQNRSWKKRLSNFYQRYTKRIVEVIGLFVILVFSVVLSFQRFLPDITLEMKSESTEKLYVLKGTPSKEIKWLKEMTIKPPQDIEFEQVTLNYKGKDIKIPPSKEGHYSINSMILLETEDKEMFKYPSKGDEFTFKLDFKVKGTFIDKPENFLYQFTDEQGGKPTDIKINKGDGYFSIFRGIPLYGIVTLLSIIWIIVIEIGYAIFIESEKDDVF